MSNLEQIINPFPSNQASFELLSQEATFEASTLQESLKNQASSITNMSREIKQKIEKINKNPKIKLNPEIVTIFEKTAQDYQAVIAQVSLELKINQAAFLKRLEHSKTPTNEVNLHKNSSCQRLPCECMVAEVKNFKNYLKKKKRDLSILFSRYDHGFKIHMQRLIALEQIH